jgi:transposase, IS5 family
VFRTVGDQCSLWEAVLPPELLRLPEELARVDALLDDPAFFTPFVPFFDPRMGRPSTPMETYLRLMFLKFRYRLGYESLCREVADSITWRRFCRIGLDGSVPHPTTLMKLTTRCGSAAVDGLNEALLARAAEAKLLRTNQIRVDTTVVPANVAYPTDSGLLATAIRRIGATGRRIQAAGGAVRTRVRDRSRAAGKRAHGIAAKLRSRVAAGSEETKAVVLKATGALAELAETAARDAERLLTNAKQAVRRATAKAAALAARGQRAAAAGRRRGRLVRAVHDLAELLARPGRSPPRPGNGSPAPLPTVPRDGSACMTSMRAQSLRAGWTSRSSSATRPRSPTTMTASCSTTPSRWATRPTRRNWRRRSRGSPNAPGVRRAPSPPLAATARNMSRTTCTIWACARS